MSILSFDTGANAKLRDSVAKSIYEREYERIMELELQFVPYQLAAYSYELADAFMAARKDSVGNAGVTSTDLDTPISTPTIVGADFSGLDDERWEEFKANPGLFRTDAAGNPVLTLEGFPQYKRGPKTTH